MPENPVIPGPPAGVDITAYRDHCGLPGQELVRTRAPVATGVTGSQLDLELDVQLEPGAVLRLGLLGSADGGFSGKSKEETVIELCRAPEGGSQGTLRPGR